MFVDVLVWVEFCRDAVCHLPKFRLASFGRHILKAYRYISSLFGIIIIASCFIPVHVFGYLCCRGSWCWCCLSSFLLLSIRLVVFIVVVVFVSILFLIRSLTVPQLCLSLSIFHSTTSSSSFTVLPLCIDCDFNSFKHLGLVYKVLKPKY